MRPTPKAIAEVRPAEEPPRAKHLLQLLARRIRLLREERGMTQEEFAARCGISEHTVKTHVEAVFAKLGVSTRAEAVASAARAGLLML